MKLSTKQRLEIIGNPVDPDPGTPVITNSLLKTFRRCPRATLYKHTDLLAPRQISKPLRRGTWMHALLEAFYDPDHTTDEERSNAWKMIHRHYSAKYSELFDEEKDSLGNLPDELKRLMFSYLWHYRKDQGWIIHEVEKKIQVPISGKFIYQGKVDMLVEDDYGLWVVDHKTMKQIPSHTQRALDVQSVLYIWACRELGIPISGFIWNYVRTEAAKPLRFNLNGALSKRQGSTDYPHARRSLLQAGKNLADYEDLLGPLRAARYDPEKPQQLSPFFERHVWEKSDKMLDLIVAEAMKTARRYLKYNFQDRDLVERVPDRSCDWCSYRSLCITDLIGGNSEIVRKQNFITQDPLSYYNSDISITVE
jgi:RecB family exonuclease